ncbi:MAG TPA: hypothetical protein VKU00_31345 [Chthonomonadaceae bacterium]|nr:hypothetical protein [Chthonomonadaceae bacterium]
MKNARRLTKPLLWMHLFLCVALLSLFFTHDTPEWMGHVWIWMVLTIQFTWGLTVGLIVGPSRARRSLLWWSLLLIFIPLWPMLAIVGMAMLFSGPLIALIYLLAFLIILGSETFCGVLLGAKLHSQDTESGVTDSNGDNGFV